MDAKNIKQVKFLLLFFLLLVVAFSSGCAGTKASSSALKPVDDGVVLTSYQNLEINTEISDGVEMSQSEADRIVGHIISKLKEKNPACFAKIGKECNAPSTLQLDTNFTRYERGNAFARFMLAGLGQMHIDASVKLSDKNTKKIIAEYEVDKTFAWGGLYGSGTKIEDIEPAFAEAIADIILQND